MDDLQSELSKSRIFTRGDLTLEIAAQQPQSTADAFELPGRVIDDKYQIVRVIGAGGMGCVYLARHLMLDKDVALKTFKSSQSTEAARSRFTREAQAIARLSHANIVQVFDFGRIDNEIPYYTMEFLQGASLANKLQESGSLPVQTALEFFAQVCSGLDAAHKKGIVHRDLKPDNIFLQTGNGNLAAAIPKIVDFGIAALVVADAEKQKLTSQGEIFGSPLYMSPEQSLGLEITAQSDIYSCGCALFEALTGKPPFIGHNAFATMLMHQNAAIPSLRAISGGREFPAALETLLKNMLAKDPEKRIQGAAQVEDHLMRIITIIKKNELAKAAQIAAAAIAPQTSKTRHLPVIAAAISGLIIAGAACGFFYSKDKRPAPAPHHSAPIANADINHPRVTQPVGIKALSDGGKISNVNEITAKDKNDDYTDGDYQVLTEKDWQKKLKEGSSTQSLSFDNRRLPPGTFERLARYKWLKSLHIDYCFIDKGTDLSPISKLPALSSLHSRLTNLDARTFSQLARCNQIKELNFKNVPATDDTAKILTPMKNLEKLSLSDCIQLTDKGVESLSHCRHLFYLDLDGDAKITDASINSLKKMNLEHLKMQGTRITDAGLMQLADQQKLLELSIGYTNVTARGVRAFLKKRGGLIAIGLNGNQFISDIDFQQLQKEFPQDRFTRKSASDDDIFRQNLKDSKTF